MKKIKGFTLIEVSLVLLIIAFILGSFLTPLSTKLEEQSINKAKEQVSEIKQAIINFTVSNSRMPCPDTNDDGLEDFIAGNCTDIPNVEGKVPYVTINSPHKQDPWGQKYLYRVANVFADNIDGTGCGGTPRPNVSIELCSANSGNINVLDYNLITGLSDQAANNLAAIILSTGRNTGINSLAQNENINDDNTFYKTSYGGTGSTMPFNDIVIWVSASEVVSELINAQILP